MRNRLGLAKLLALLVPLGLLAGAYGSEYWGGLHPCEMCWWQRYAHFAALPFAALAMVVGAGRDRALLWLAAAAIAASGAIGVYHAGVELGYFEGFTQCTAQASGSVEDLLKSVFEAPLVRCDEIQWSFLGVSMAGWNAILSLSAALLILWLSLSRSRAA